MEKKEQEFSLTLINLWNIIENRKTADPDKSYTAFLFKKGINRISQKVGEEAVETLIAALAKDKKEVAEESADLIYHLMVLWNVCGVHPNDVFRIIENRKS